MNSRRLERANVQLERIVKERTYKITQQKEEIASKVDELQKANATKDKFFSIIAHDLRGPFSGFLGLTQIMAEDLPKLTLDQIQNLAVSMKNSATSLYNLLENLLEWARMQKGTIEFNPENIILKNVVNDVTDLMNEIAVSKKISIANLITDKMLVFADENMLKTIFRNLLSNALKFTNTGRKVEIGAVIKDENPEIYVQDNGNGIKSEDINKLFQNALNFSTSGTENEKGTGLGLMLCHEFVALHGGSIRVESEVGKGTRFSFMLPDNSPETGN